MNDRPDAVELLRAVERFLEGDVVPALDGVHRFHARVAANASPVTFHAIARAMRPPSSGSAGSRLNTSSTALISASQESSTSTIPACRPFSESATSTKCVTSR